MANEKSRNNEPAGANKGGNGKAQGKRDDQKSDAEKKSSSRSASGKPGPGKQLRDQLNVRKEPSSSAEGK